MSRRLMFASSGPGFEIPDPLPGDGGTDPGSNGLNDAWHGEYTAAMQPDWDTIIHVGPSRTLTTIAAGLAVARQQPYARLNTAIGNNRWSPGIRTGCARTAIVLDPGTYAAPVDAGPGPSIGAGIDLLGNGDSRDDVVIYTSTTDYNVMPWLGFYLANLTLHHDQGPTGNNYALHGSAMGASEQRDFTAIIDNVVGLDTNSGSSGIFGWDMPQGLRAFMYRCRFESTKGHGNVLHDEAWSDVDTLFLECEADVAFNVSVAEGSTWVVDCTTLNGTPRSNSAVIDGVTSTAPIGIPVTLPVEGMVSAEAAKYAGGIAAPGVEHVPDFPDTTSLSGFTAGRTYYVPLTLPRSSKIAGARLNVVTAAGSVAAGVFAGLTPGASGWGYLSYGDATTPSGPGNVTRPIYADDADLWLPATMQLWLTVRINSPSCVVKASAGMSAAHQCYYSDDASTPATGGINPFPSGITALPSGAAVPWVALVTG